MKYIVVNEPFDASTPLIDVREVAVQEAMRQAGDMTQRVYVYAIELIGVAELKPRFQTHTPDATS